MLIETESENFHIGEFLYTSITTGMSSKGPDCINCLNQVIIILFLKYRKNTGHIIL